MSFSISQTDTLLMSMIQQDCPTDIMMDETSGDIQSRVFAGKLDKLLQSAGRKTVGTVDENQKDQTGQKDQKDQLDQIGEFSRDLASQFSQILEEQDGQAFVTALKNIFLMLTQGRLDAVEVDASALETIEKLLLKAGFQKKDVDELISNLLEKTETQALELDEVFDMIADLSDEDLQSETETKDLIVAPDTALFIESALITLGLDQDQIEKIFSAADKGDSGYDLDIIVTELNKIQKQAFYSQTDYKVPKSNANLTTIVQGLGAKLENFEGNQFSLNDFVKILEQIKTTAEPVAAGTAMTDLTDKNQTIKEKPAELLSELFKCLKVDKDKTVPARTEILADNKGITVQNKANILIDNDGDLIPEKLMSGKDLKPKNSLMTSAADQKSNENRSGNFAAFVKEVEELAGQKTNDTLLQKEQILDVKQRFQRTTAVEKLSDQTQGVFSQAKSDDAQLKIEIQKPAVPAKPLPAYVTQQVGKGLVRAINQGESSMTVQLKPPELGRLLLTIDNTNNMTRVNIMTENHAAKEILTQNIHELKSLLSNSGVNLEKFEVDMSNDFRQSMADARQQAGFSGRQKGKNQRLDSNGDDPQATEVSPAANSLNAESLNALHLVA